MLSIASTNNENKTDIDSEVVVPVRSESDFTFSVAGNTTVQDTKEEDYDDEDLVPLGDDKSLNVTFDEDGTPLVTVNKAQVDALAALLMEHDERFHFDFPGKFI